MTVARATARGSAPPVRPEAGGRLDRVRWPQSARPVETGAVDAAIKVLKDKVVLPGHLPELIAAIKPAVAAGQKAKSGELLDNATVENVRRQVARLKSAAPLIQQHYAAKKIDIVGGVYDIATGKVTML